MYEYQKAVQSGIDYDNAQAVAKKFLATPYDPKATQTAEAITARELYPVGCPISFSLSYPDSS